MAAQGFFIVQCMEEDEQILLRAFMEPPMRAWVKI